MTARKRIVAAGSLAACVAAATVLGYGSQAPTSTSNKPAIDATSGIVASAEALVAILDDAGRRKVQFAYDDAAQRKRWSNLPVGIFGREGVRLGDLTPPQRAAAMKLLATALSPMGYQKVVDIMHGDEVLRQNAAGGGGRGPNFGQDEYFLSFLGKPSATTPWMLQFGGHHLAINLTIAGAQATMAPSLPAAQPATFTFEGRSVRPLGKETDKAFALINALDAKQRTAAVLTSGVKDLVLGATADGRTIQPEGIRASALSPAQQSMLWELAREWAGIMADGFAASRMSELQAKVADTYFAWSGPTTPGSPSYFRIQGPTLVIEYAPQGGTDHIHTIYRDPTNDYGAAYGRK